MVVNDHDSLYFESAGEVGGSKQKYDKDKCPFNIMEEIHAKKPSGVRSGRVFPIDAAPTNSSDILESIGMGFHFSGARHMFGLP